MRRNTQLHKSTCPHHIVSHRPQNNVAEKLTGSVSGRSRQRRGGAEGEQKDKSNENPNNENGFVFNLGW